jgi:hypothetical protein
MNKHFAKIFLTVGKCLVIPECLPPPDFPFPISYYFLLSAQCTCMYRPLTYSALLTL